MERIRNTKCKNSYLAIRKHNLEPMCTILMQSPVNDGLTQ